MAKPGSRLRAPDRLDHRDAAQKSQEVCFCPTRLSGTDSEGQYERKAPRSLGTTLAGNWGGENSKKSVLREHPGWGNLSAVSFGNEAEMGHLPRGGKSSGGERWKRWTDVIRSLRYPCVTDLETSPCGQRFMTQQRPAQ